LYYDFCKMFIAWKIKMEDNFGYCREEQKKDN